MATFGRDDELRGAEFRGADLRDARFVSCDLSGTVIRGSDVVRMEIDSPWLFDGETFLRVNGVDVLPLVDAELNRRFPGRADRFAPDPEGLRRGWASLEAAWAAVEVPAGAEDESVAGEWSYAQTLRHLVVATDIWLGAAILRLDQPYHPLGLPNEGAERHGFDMSVLSTATPTYAEVREARAGRVAMVRDFLATVSPELLDENRPNPWAPEHQVTVRHCLHTILEEEWEHLRYAVRDLETVSAKAKPSGSGEGVGVAVRPAE